MKSDSLATDKIKISLDLSKQIVDDVDTIRKENGMTRTQWIQIAIMEKLRKSKRMNDSEKLDK